MTFMTVLSAEYDSSHHVRSYQMAGNAEQHHQVIRSKKESMKDSMKAWYCCVEPQYIAVISSLVASSAAAFGIPKVLAFSFPGWRISLNLTRTTLSALFSVGNLCGAFFQPYIGKNVDKWGPKHSLVVMLLFICGPFYAPIIAQEIFFPPLRMAIMVLAIFGIRVLQAGIDTAGNVLINHWFLKQRGRVSSIRQIFYVCLQDLVLVQIVQNLDDWRATSHLSVAVCFVAMSWIFIFAINTPEEIGMKPDGKWVESTGIEYESLLDGKQAMQTSSFWLLLTNNVFYCIVGPTTTLFLLDIVMDTVGDAKLKQINLAQCVYIPHFILAVLVGTASGWMIDYGVEIRYILAFSSFCLALSTYISTEISSPSTAILFGIIRGCVGGTRQSVKQTVWANYYGREHLGEITGISRTCEMLGMSLGPLFLGVSREHFGEYRTGCYAMSALCWFQGWAMLFLKKPVHPSSLAEPAA
ncbi:hypothetical protein GUITHDRAFT_109868 [Guillardia theta CCMP2712]|uniref:Major facilitator superfamily (MFS) profile domain-containing protein n=1 Tax=Guillardia theta (strain CCMP2712) TaxID=905079 RepID=L1J7M3_GUITC|nr:hypothetical protein GUITHDRAFT_109868 [Guillardia theta CCMP2712]EKX44085.1 hypothetical protein GUITHDRAFT_109868 [Guillardia theta CCMP2712]|eukprot:XP_005831065.1 hypothetical protein GUITHDRAFT_109868 [Guillardia theta CCMP2712]